MKLKQVPLMAAALVVPSCSIEPELVCELDLPGVNVVQIGVDELAGGVRWEVRELWRAGGLHDDSEMTFPTSGRVGPDGTFAVTDFGIGEVWLFGADGEFMGSAGSRGQGPGELLSPLAAAWTPEGDLLVLDAGNQRLERLSPGGAALETLSLPNDLLGPVFASGQVGWYGLTGDGTTFIELPTRVTEDGDGTVVFARGDPGREVREVVWESHHPPGEVPGYNLPSLPEWPRSMLGTGGTGWVVAPRSSRYELIFHDAMDEPRLHLCVSDARVFGQRPIGDEEIMQPEELGLDELSPPADSALFSRVMVDAEDRIWIERDLPQVGAGFDEVYGTPAAQLDVISWDGEYLGSVRLPKGVRFQDARGDTVWGFSIGEFNEVEVFAGTLTAIE